ncbi:Glucuronoxylan 4-O-methyltransferase 1 [Acorus calamus]|uniref:Glucuronoxylan 4-O-methyltransferase 1 n=1 Tax=Acorus calamus TaxID=4465 RepID=A0AAV9BXH6_ACOCL|nr:Glucuronoxylan 4-O-methyltransferase 1 [Acorus calamus]
MFAAATAAKRWFTAVTLAAVIAGALLISSFIRSGDRSVLCSLSSATTTTASTSSDDNLLSTILHYATTPVTPQQSLAEIRITYDVLRRSASPSAVNFLVFGLGHDSPMWSAFNHRGTTLFLEEDPKWFQIVLKKSPNLNAHSIEYPTRLVQARDLLSSYRSEPYCLPPKAFLRGNRRCRLALADLPREVYEREWDLIMIDAPKGYYKEAPGRMGAIFSAAVMARGRRSDGPTHVFVHDVNRRVERAFALEFLCKKNLVKGIGRLWHFVIHPVREGDANRTALDGGSGGFC